MIYVGSLLSGVINGLFASGAGQIIVFLFIYFLKIETHTARATSVFLMGLVTIVTFVRYLGFVQLNIMHVIVVIISGLVFGIVGSKLMKKLQPDYLNLISGLVIAGFAIYNIIR
ncbi:MAG: sulfite exporter TauE/SafE family protein [Clostridia bacterium]|nr:sulfite exporter TauE/SafE family protein [Clostridia bacterium]